MDIDDYLDELDSLVETVEVQRKLYQKTDQERSHIEGPEGPVNEEIARYNIGSLDSFMKVWNKAYDAAMEIIRQKDVDRIDKDLRRYRKIERKIFENRDFLEDIYDLNKPLSKTKVEARYP